MDAKSSADVPLSSPAAAQRCAEGAGLDSGAPAAAQSAMPSIALPATAPTADHFPPTPLHPRRLSFTLRISTSLTDVTAKPRALPHHLTCFAGCSRRFVGDDLGARKDQP